MANSCVLTMYYADCTGNAKNNKYSHRIDVVDTASLMECVSHDYVCAEFSNYRRSNANFITSNCAGFDIDNEFSDNPNDWITAEKIAQEFEPVTYAIHYSRNHMKCKGSQSARPRFHIIFATDTIISAAEHKQLKEQLSKYFPFVDPNAVDASRFFFGTTSPDVEFHAGTMSLNAFLAENDDSWCRDLENIPEGQRNATLSHTAGILIKRYGATEEAKRLFLAEVDKCSSPLPQEEIDHIWDSACNFGKQIAKQEDYIPPEIYNFKPSLIPNDFSDVGQAEILSREHENELVFTTATGYLRYNGILWEASDEKAQAVVQDLTTSQLDDAEGYRLKAMELMKQNGALSILASMSKSKALNLFTPEQKYSYNMFEEAMNYKNFVIKRRDSKYISSALKEARPMLLKAPEDLDANADDLNTPTAIYHLPDGIAGARPHEASDLMTKVTAVSPDNNGNEIWMDALNKFFCNDTELIQYVQMIVGLAAIGKVYVEALIIAYGEGRNGKSTFWNTIAKVMGTYSGNISADALTVGCRRNVKPELAETKGKRILIASELEEGTRLNTATIKQLCSTDQIYGEKKYKDPLSFTPSHLTVLYTNHLPKVGATDPGTWRRLIVIPFNAKIEGKSDIKNYADYLFENAGGAVLTWIIEGAKMVYLNNFQINPPECVQNAIKAYREENDWLDDFLCECCEINDSYKEKSGELYSSYRGHCMNTGEYIRGTADFYAAIEHAGFERKRDKSGRYVKGLRLKSIFAA